LEQGH
jgi:hypothetical protein